MTPARERAEHLHALALMGITTPNQTWLASIDFDALKAKWAADEEYEQWLDERNSNDRD